MSNSVTAGTLITSASASRGVLCCPCAHPRAPIRHRRVPGRHFESAHPSGNARSRGPHRPELRCEPGFVTRVRRQGDCHANPRTALRCRPSGRPAKWRASTTPRAPEIRGECRDRGSRGRRNFNQFINRYRVEEAARRLVDEPRTPVLTIALDVGFRSISSFNTAFRAHYRKTPTDYRKSRLADS